MRKFVLLLPLIYLLPRILPMDQTKAVYLSEPIADTLAVTFTVILFTFQFRKALRRWIKRQRPLEEDKQFPIAHVLK